ncbi:helix-turn-helix transcriptional regulator [Eggerthella guodeyinii]|uniref:Helix-turn-helix transcriptional regulator n=1 Tax=Eggerthella guodeyinii TaxID=2690837 RepID=A0A6L7ITC1_9ACTN|nr:helix-turn-helix transcriptional regulator [Eggerthella guodeyinii]QOS66689.1 helix-turn-helix transcriptional regulator [Eggerthella guodeyinii]
MDTRKDRLRFGQRVRERREEQSLSQRKLALMIGMDNTYLGRIEAGRCSLSIDTMSRIASALDVEIRELF